MQIRPREQKKKKLKKGKREEGEEIQKSSFPIMRPWS